VVQQPWKTNWQFLKKLNIDVPYDLAIPQYTTRYKPKRNENICSNKTRTWMFIAALFVNTKRYKEPKWPSMDEWINKM